MATIDQTYALAMQNHQAGHLQLAEELYRQVLQAEPRHTDAYHLLGVLACQTNRFDLGATLIRQAVLLNPHVADYQANLGLAYEALGKAPEAVASLESALRIRADLPEAHNSLGNVFVRLGKKKVAAVHYREALRLRPDFAKAHCGLGVALNEKSTLDEAAAHWNEALRLNPDYAEVHNNLASMLLGQGMLEQAAAHAERAQVLQPLLVDAWINLGNARSQQCRWDEASVCYDEAIRQDPNRADAHHNRALLWLLQGKWEQGWPEFEWRWKTKEFSQYPFSQPRWDGSTLAGRTILLVAEQGLGDTLQFIRYVSLVQQQGGRVIVECQPPLHRLLSGCLKNVQLVARGEPLPHFDEYAPLLSLPGLLGTSLTSIPAAVPYLQADAELVARWRAALWPMAGFKIGIAWQGSPAYGYDRMRSIPLAWFSQLAKVEGVRLISLQKGPGTEQLNSSQVSAISYQPKQSTEQMQAALERNAVLDLGSSLDGTSGAFMDTAAVMQNMDLVITSDNAVCHLAGALGVPVWVALARVPDWRWLLDRSDSPWYPTMRLFRQERYGQWDEVLERMAGEIRSLVVHGLAVGGQ